MESALLTWAPVEGASSYQVVVYDRTEARSLLDKVVDDTTYEMRVPDKCSSHELVMRTRPLEGAEWGAWTEFEPFPLGIILGERRESAPPLAHHDRPNLLFMFTVDTECSVLRQPNPDPDRVVDELIFGEFGNGGAPGGIGLQMDLLEHFGLRGTFFVDVLMEFEHGREALERTIAAIAERGHEVELHVHPERLEGSTDSRAVSLVEARSKAGGVRSAEFMRRVLELSIDLFERRVGRRPVAYRAGGFRISDEHFPVLDELGIRIDSSVQPYYNSRVSEWMRTRTQPFRVGGVLEIPPTFVLLNDRPDAWEARALAPSFGLGDPISTLPVRPGELPFVATLVSHSFQLLRCQESRGAEAVKAFEERLRRRLPAGAAERLLPRRLSAVRTYGEEIDDGLVAHVASLLRRVAERPDARCVTYAEVAESADRLWPAERRPQVDRIALLNRRRGATAVTATRIFSEGLLSHLVSARSFSPAAGPPDPDPGWTRFRTLGVIDPARRGALPPLAEILFPTAVVRAVADQAGVDLEDEAPWDVPTLRAWLEARGFEVVDERRVPRGREEMEVLERSGEKLACLDPVELSTEAWDVELRPVGSPRPADASTPLERLPVLAADLYGSVQPGHEVQFRLADAPSMASRTTVLLAMLRAGFEVLDCADDACCLVRPIDLPDILRFAGVA
jgi:hypothetical protein